MAPTVISVSLSVTLTDAIFAPTATAAAAVTAAAPSPAIVAVTIRVPPYRVTVIIPLPWAIVSLPFIPSSLNLRSQIISMSVKYQVKLLSVKQIPTHTCNLCCSESLTGDCDSLAEKTSSLVRPHDLARKTKYSNYK